MAKNLIQTKFIEEPFLKLKLMKFLENRLRRARLANIEIQRTPLVTRIILYVTNPGRIIGRGGREINKLTEEIKKTFNINNPQVMINEVINPSLEPRLIGKRAARSIELGRRPRAVIHSLIKEIMANGAIGAEIIVSGSMSKGARAKRIRAGVGFIPKAGEPSRLVKEAHVTANTKVGVIGVFVRIVPPGTKFPDKEVVEEVELPKIYQKDIFSKGKTKTEKREVKAENKGKEENKEKEEGK